MLGQYARKYGGGGVKKKKKQVATRKVPFFFVCVCVCACGNVVLSFFFSFFIWDVCSSSPLPHPTPFFFSFQTSLKQCYGTMFCDVCVVLLLFLPTNSFLLFFFFFLAQSCSAVLTRITKDIQQPTYTLRRVFIYIVSQGKEVKSVQSSFFFFHTHRLSVFLYSAP